ncbi:MAG: ABC transporter substrate-binding protein [Clostridia bacterium]|nr:ABC transporter substrate-binding protein [Clostridia bacterium]
MKKFISTILCALLLCGVFAGCGADPQSGTVAQVYAPDGAPAISMAKLIADEYAGAEFHVVPPENIGAAVLTGKADIAIMPTNAAASLHAKDKDIVMVGVTNFGSLYVVGKGEEVTSLQELTGKVVYSIGQGKVPDLVFRILLQAAEIPYEFSSAAKEGVVSLAYVSEGAEFVSGLTAGKMQYGVISEPAATVAQNKVQGAKRMLDIQKLYADATGSENGFPQAALITRKSFVNENAAYISDFMNAFRAGMKWAETEPSAALEAIQKAGSTTVPMLTEQIAKGCNLGFLSAGLAREQLLDFYTRLNEVKEEGETPVGDSMPDLDFFVSDL